MNINKVQIVGRVTQQPEARKLPSDATVVNFSVATNRTWKTDGVEQSETEFHNITAFGKVADVIAQYVVKGQEIYVEGRLKTRSWEDKDTGQKRYKTDIILEQFQFGAKPKGAEQAAQEQADPEPAPEPEQAQMEYGDGNPEDDIVDLKDIPF